MPLTRRMQQRGLRGMAIPRLLAVSPWATVPTNQRPSDRGLRAYLDEIWHPEFGDRHQTLTLVGTDMDRDKLSRRLQKCLLTEEELAHPEQWSTMHNPFSWPKAQ